MCFLVYKCLHQAAATYLAELCSPVSESANRGHLRSAARGDLAVPRSRTTTYGQRCFAVSGPTLWNLLPLSVRDPSLTPTQFCVCLKTVLFSVILGLGLGLGLRPQNVGLGLEGCGLGLGLDHILVIVKLLRTVAHVMIVK